MLPEAGQGALALQVRAGEEYLVEATDDADTRRRVEAERRCVAAVGGGCLAPVAAFHDGATLTGLIAAEDGSWVERREGPDPKRSAAPWPHSPAERRGRHAGAERIGDAPDLLNRRAPDLPCAPVGHRSHSWHEVGTGT